MPDVLKRLQLRSERGITMFLVVVAMLVTTMFVAAAFAAVNGDLPVSGVAVERKSSYAAAEAGLNFYLNRLQQDPDYWTKCDTGKAPNSGELNPVNQLGASPLRWRTIPGSSDEYTIELIPAPGYTSCVVGKQYTFVDMNTGTFKVKVTARSYTGQGRTRSIVATFRRDSFLNFVYFTNYENRDPSAEDDDTERARQVKYCADRYRSARAGNNCPEIQFATADKLNGPLHTNDDNLLICGTPTFGRLVNEDGTTRTTKTDYVEVRGGGTGHVANGTSCADTPTINTPTGKFSVNAKPLALPESNAELLAVAKNGGTYYSGITKIFLRGNMMDVTTSNGNKTTSPLPNNGVIYVDNASASCDGEIPTRANYDEATSCGNVYVSGTYSQPLTIAAANDVIVAPTDPNNVGNADIRQTGSNDAVLGLIANNFVRVMHRVTRGSSCTNTNSLAYPTLTNIRVEAAILALQHSWIVDNYDCGKAGTLTVSGAIVQKYRGPVGTGSSSGVATGYAKNYWYDDRFLYRSPPYFLTPVAAAWDIVREHEIVAGS